MHKTLYRWSRIHSWALLHWRMCPVVLTYVALPRKDGTKTELPMKTSGRYLGTMMSFHAFELQTWHHRKHAGWLAFARLKC